MMFSKEELAHLKWKLIQRGKSPEDANKEIEEMIKQCHNTHIKNANMKKNAAYLSKIAKFHYPKEKS